MSPRRSRAKASAKAAQARYDAAGMGRRIAKWNPPASGPVKAVEGLEKIRNRSRDAIRNDWAAEGGVQKWVSNLVGVGIQPRWTKKEIRALWDSWGPQADADGVCDIYGLEALGTRSWLDGGEVFIRRRPRALTSPLEVPLQIQLIESDYVPVFDADQWPGLPEGHKITQGIERNRFGQRTAYWVYREHPGDGSVGPSKDQLVRVAASDMAHVFEPKRPGQLRGVSPLASILVKLRSIMDFEDAVLERQKLANLFTMFITRALPPNWADLDVDPDTGLPKFYDRNGNPMAGLEPGISQELMPGEDVKFANPPEAGTGYSDYMRSSHLGTAAGQGLPYELLTGDIRDVSDRTLRVVINEFRRFAQQRQWLILIPMMCQRIAEWFADAAVLAGKLPMADRELARRPMWSPHGWEYIHPVQDVQGKQLAVEAGFTSKSAVILERGDDPDAVFEQRAKDQESERRLGLGEEPEDPESEDPDEEEAIQQMVSEHVRREIRAFREAPEDPKVLERLAQDMRDKAEHRETMTQVVAGILSVASSVAALAQRPTEVHAHVAPAQVNVTNDVQPTPVNVEVAPAQVNVTNDVQPTPVNVEVAAPNVAITNEVQPAEVRVELPDRETTSVIERDQQGNITNVTQVERTLQ